MDTGHKAEIARRAAGELKAKREEYDQALAEYTAVGTPPVRFPKKVMTPEAIASLERAEKEVEEAEKAWREAMLEPRGPGWE